MQDDLAPVSCTREGSDHDRLKLIEAGLLFTDRDALAFGGELQERCGEEVDLAAPYLGDGLPGNKGWSDSETESRDYDRR